MGKVKKSIETTDQVVLHAEDSTATESPKNNKTTKQNKKKATNVTKPGGVVEVRGMPKSNRPWKSVKTKFATIKKSLNRGSYEKKEALRNELRHMKEVSRELREERKQSALEKHQRRVENAERRLANERRSEVVQVIKNPSKLKRMKKKQLRMVEKRDLSQVKVV